MRTVTGKPVGFKSVFGDVRWLEDMAREIHKRGIEHAPDFITVDGGDGGTGAAPQPLMDSVGLPLQQSLPMVVDVLHSTSLHDRIRVIASGKLITPSSVAWALGTGADYVSSARGFMFSLGCIQALKCNKNTCPTGITTHNPQLIDGLDPAEKSVRVATYHGNIVHDVEVIAHSCGAEDPRGLSRDHMRVVQANGRTITMQELWPQSDPRRP